MDTIQEHEKYGNSGDKFLPIGRAIVNGYEGFSNILNRVLDVCVNNIVYIVLFMFCSHKCPYRACV